MESCKINFIIDNLGQQNLLDRREHSDTDDANEGSEDNNHYDF